MRGTTHALVLLVVMMPSPTAAAGQGPVASSGLRKLLPRDDSASDPSFLAFSNRLLDAARRGDRSALRPLMADVVSASFDEMPAEQLLQSLRPGQPWRELVEALELGTTKETDGDGGHYFMAPYVSSYANDLDGYEELAVIGRNVRLRRAPRVDAEVLERLTYDVVSVVHELRGRDEILRLDSPAS